MPIHRQMLRVFDALDYVLRLEIDARRSILDMPVRDFLDLARAGSDALYERADAVRTAAAPAERVCREARELLGTLDGEDTRDLEGLCSRLEDALVDLEERGIYSVFNTRAKVTAFPVAQPMSDAECEAAWSAAIDRS